MGNLNGKYLVKLLSIIYWPSESFWLNYQGAEPKNLSLVIKLEYLVLYIRKIWACNGRITECTGVVRVSCCNLDIDIVERNVAP